MAFEPNNITKEHVLSAVDKILKSSKKLIKSTGYDVLINGQIYPPKEIMRYAHEEMNGDKLWNYGGGPMTNKYLEKFGFEIVVKKEEKIALMVARYKIHINETRLSDELYKWKLLKTFNNRPDVLATDFNDELSSIDYNNLIYYMAGNCIKHIALESTDKARQLFVNLFDDSISLDNRVNDFMSISKVVYRDMLPDGIHEPHQDERTIATYLAYYDSSKYALFKDSFYKKYCKLIGEKAKQKGKKYSHYLLLLNDFIKDYILPDKELLSLKKELLADDSFSDENNLIFAQDILYQMLDKEDESKVKSNTIEIVEEFKPVDQNTTLNTILYGPPGTGKTFNTVNEALKIVDPLFYNENANDRKKLKQRFKELNISDWNDSKGQISFCTFHQSMCYEDFVEGIKPKTKGDNVVYEIEEGIFKNICRLARDQNKSEEVKVNRLIDLKDQDFKDAEFYKISLGDSTNINDNEIYEYCIDNGCISMGFGEGIDFTGLSRDEIIKRCKENNLGGYNVTALDYFINKIEIGNYVVIGKGNRYVRAIGKVVGEYRCDSNTSIGYNDFRDVEWIFVNEEIPIKEIYEKSLSQQTIYKLDANHIKKDFFVAVKKDLKEVDFKKEYVLIIDEINRGNVSQIFGELITLIENDKRAGADEELEVILPYSKEIFKVPSNVHIIGTMNTADRSVESLDTALRRRFNFVEMPPKAELIMEVGCEIVDDIDLVNLLNVINERIEVLIDRDHMIGHSYFMSVKSIEDLTSVFYNNIIPLLQEYFFCDYGKIGLVLGSGFVEKKKSLRTDVFAKFDYSDSDMLLEKDMYSLVKIKSSDLRNAIDILLNNKNE